MLRSILRFAPLSLCLAACSERGSPQDGPSSPTSMPNGAVNSPASASPGPPAVPSGAPSPLAPDAAVAIAMNADFASSTRSNLQWKRYAAFESDLASALALPKDKLCAELGRASCVRNVHLTPLGGHDPFATGLLEPSVEPLATTPTVVERVVLSACSAKVAVDAREKSSEVFGGLALAQPAPAPTDTQNRALVSAMYRRLLARDADESELSLLAQLALDELGKPVSGRDFALSVCVAVGTSTEFIFF